MPRGNKNKLFGLYDSKDNLPGRNSGRKTSGFPFNTSKPSKAPPKKKPGGLDKNRFPFKKKPKTTSTSTSKYRTGTAKLSDGFIDAKTKAPYSGPYHEHVDTGKCYKGSTHKTRGFFSKRKEHELIKTSPKKDDKKGWPKRPPIGIPSKYRGGVNSKPASANASSIEVELIPYKPLNTYINQYPAEDSAVAPAKDSVEPSYGGGGISGHLGNTESLPPLVVSYEGSAPSISQITAVGGTYLNFILAFKGSFYTSPQYLGKLNQAAAENNPYFRIDRNTVPIIAFNSANPNFDSYSNNFAEEDEYAMVDVNYSLSSNETWVRHIDWCCRKTNVDQGVRTSTDLYGSKPYTVKAEATDIDAILASAGKPPKVRFKGKQTGGTVAAKTTTPPKKKKKIICNELYQQGYLPEHIWDADERWGDKTFITDPKLVIGYQMWARKVVEYMRRKPQHTPIIYFLCKPWTEWMAYDLGVLPKNNLKGQLTQFVGRYFSYAVYDLFGGDKLYKRYHKLT